jgi:hypothetical protein
MTPRIASFLVLPTALLALLAQGSPSSFSKRAVELPLEDALDASAAPAPTADGKVAPGLVRWHADFAAACAAARASGKPVLLFQLLGRLDDELC